MRQREPGIVVTTVRSLVRVRWRTRFRWWLMRRRMDDGTRDVVDRVSADVQRRFFFGETDE